MPLGSLQAWSLPPSETSHKREVPMSRSSLIRSEGNERQLRSTVCLLSKSLPDTCQDCNNVRTYRCFPFSGSAYSEVDYIAHSSVGISIKRTLNTTYPETCQSIAQSNFVFSTHLPLIPDFLAWLLLSHPGYQLLQQVPVCQSYVLLPSLYVFEHGVCKEQES